jgi:GxxExxY protein
MELKGRELTEQIIKAFYAVYNKLRHGFLEIVYEKSLLIELRKMGLNALRQQKIEVYYEDEMVGYYFADSMVNHQVIIEVKAVASLHQAHEAQLKNYLRGTHIEIGLLFNFGEKPQFSRRYFSNEKKNPPNPPDPRSIQNSNSD